MLVSLAMGNPIGGFWIGFIFECAKSVAVGLEVEDDNSFAD